MLAPFGRYWRMSPLAFSLLPLSHSRPSSFVRVRFGLLRPKHPLDAVRMRLGGRERAVLLEQFARAALHAREDVLRHLGELPTLLRQRHLAEDFLQLPPVLFEERRQLHGQLVTEFAE